MPNWCVNELTITGPQSDREACLAAVSSDESPLDFNSIKPYPEEYAELDRKWQEARLANPTGPFPTFKDGYNNGGYEWCTANWGTKWNACRVQLEVPENTAYFSFETAWSPPTPVITALGALYPTLTFKLHYWEGGAGYRGTLTVTRGKITTDATYSYTGLRGG